MYADITWTAYIGENVPERQRKVFAAVVGARDSALAAIDFAFEKGYPIQGCEADRVAREYIERAGYGGYFGRT